MKCSKCGLDCVGFSTGNPEDDMCDECSFPALANFRKRLDEKYSSEEYRKVWSHAIDRYNKSGIVWQ